MDITLAANAFLLVCVALVTFNFFVIMRNKPSYSQTYAALFLLSLTVSCMGYFLEVNSTQFSSATLGIASVGVSLEYIGDNLAFLFFTFFLASWLDKKIPSLLNRVIVACSVVLVIFSLPSDVQYLYFTPVGLSVDSLVTTMEVEDGVLTVASYVFQLSVVGWLIYEGCKSLHESNRKKDRFIFWLLLLAQCFPIVSTVAFSVGGLSGMDTSPIAYLLSQILVAYCIMKKRAFDLLPETFENIVTTAQEFICVLDSSDNVLFVNKAAKEALGTLPQGEPLPQSARECFCEESFALGDKYYRSSSVEMRDKGVTHGMLLTATDVTSFKQVNDLLEARQKRFEYDLACAATIQTNALPRIFPPWPERIDFDIFALMHPASLVGGDFYDFFLVDDNHLGVVVADVAGKGMPAALFMMSAKTYVKHHLMSGMKPDEALSCANDQLCEGNDAEMFVTVWALLIDLRDGSACFANAGHNPPYIRRQQREWEAVKVRPNMVLADTPGLTYRLHELQFEEGDCLFLFTDGVSEAMDEQRNLFGEKRLEGALNGNVDKNPESLLSGVLGEVELFSQGAEQSDDITMVALEVRVLAHHVRLPATRSSCEVAADFTRARLGHIGCSKKDLMRLMILQDEIISNIVRYAYGDQFSKAAGSPDEGSAYAAIAPEGVFGKGVIGFAEENELTIEIYMEDLMLVMRFIDAGVPFNPLDEDRVARDYDDEWDTGGDGIKLVKHFADECLYEYTRGMNIFTIRKRVEVEGKSEQNESTR